MRLEKIITLANENSRLRFLAMERSLRTAGCKLPLWVIPYDDNKFDLPENAMWWELGNVTTWLNTHHTHKMMRKYQCLLESNYQFVDSDVIFLKNPEKVLLPHSGFMTSCGHWHNPGHTTTTDLLSFFQERTTVWQQKVFNAGQFACDRAVYDYDRLKETAEKPAFRDSCLYFKYHDQPGLNLLVNRSGIPITNITLQPYYMESTWAGDYTDENFERFWKNEDRKPYLLHWAGCNMNIKRPIDQLFLNYLTEEEKYEWSQKLATTAAKQKKLSHKMNTQLGKLKAALKLLAS